MKTIILDKNILQGCDKEGEALKKIRQRYKLLLTDVLLQEIYTQNIEKKDSLSQENLNRLDVAVETNIRKAVQETGNSWIDRETALQWEVEKGKSAKYAPRFSITKILPRKVILSEDLAEGILNEERKHRCFVTTKYMPDDYEFETYLNKICGDAIFSEIANIFSDDRIDLIRNWTNDLLVECAKRNNLKSASSLFPETDWFSYGYMKVSLAYEFLKKAGRKIFASGKEVNAFYDMELLAYVAITDGIVTNDKIMQKMAWAIWPEKRNDIFSYDYEKGLLRFIPEWMK